MSLLTMLSAAASFSPLQIPGLLLWLSADNISGNDGDPVSTWPDSSGLGNNATGTTTQRPTLKRGILNGHAVVRFNGTANGLITPSIDLSGTPAASVFIVGTSAAGGTQAAVEFSNNYNNFNDGFLLFKDTTNFLNVSAKGDSNFSTYVTKSTVTTSARLFGGVIDKSTTNAEAGGFIGGYQFGYVSSNASNTNNFGNRPLYVGARAQASLFWSGDLPEIIVYNRDIGGTNTAKVRDYLNLKYGLSWTGANGVVIFDGDSLTFGTASTTANGPYPPQCANLLIADGRTYVYGAYGVAGQTLANMISDAASQIDTLYQTGAAKNICVIWGGTNDMGTAGGANTAAAAYARLQSYCASRRAAGWKVIALTCLARNDANAPADFGTKRNSYNTLIRAGAPADFDVLVDLATDVRLDDGTSTLPVGVDSGDHVHLTNAGYGFVAALVKTAVESL